MLGKWSGRIGDTPLIGAGTYADRAVAVSCTGKGEAFIRAVTAKAVAERFRAGGDLRGVLTKALEEVVHFGGSGGLICVTHEGHIGFGFNSLNMAYAWKTDRADAERAEAAEVGARAGYLYDLEFRECSACSSSARRARAKRRWPAPSPPS